MSDRQTTEWIENKQDEFDSEPDPIKRAKIIDEFREFGFDKIADDNETELNSCDICGGFGEVTSGEFDDIITKPCVCKRSEGEEDQDR